MANRYAVANGNFDDINTWSSTPGGTGGASVPGPNDVAHANNRTVTITSSIEVSSIVNTSINSATAGGGFTCAVSDITLGLGAASVSNSTALIDYTGSGAITITQITVPSNNSTNSSIIQNSGSGSILVSSAAITYNTQVTNYVFRNSSSGSISIDSIVLTSYALGGCLLINTSSGSCHINSGVIYNGGAAATNAIQNTSNGSIHLSNVTLYGTSASGVGYTVNNTSTGSIIITASIIEATNGGGVLNGGTNPNAVNRISGIIKHAANGTAPITGLKWSVGSTPTDAYYLASLDGFSTFLAFHQEGSALAGTNHPNEDHVRNGVIYGPTNALIGTCHVPAAASVAAGVPVDNTVGTAVLTPAAVQAIVGAAVAGAVTND